MGQQHRLLPHPPERGGCNGRRTLDENPTYAKAFGFMQLESGVESPVAGYDECRSAISEMLTNVLDGGPVDAELADGDQCL